MLDYSQGYSLINRFDVGYVRLVTESKLGNERNSHKGRNYMLLMSAVRPFPLSIMLIINSLVWIMRILDSSFD
jgi:hypothetical protein